MHLDAIFTHADKMALFFPAQSRQLGTARRRRPALHASARKRVARVLDVSRRDGRSPQEPRTLSLLFVRPHVARRDRDQPCYAVRRSNRDDGHGRSVSDQFNALPGPGDAGDCTEGLGRKGGGRRGRVSRHLRGV